MFSCSPHLRLRVWSRETGSDIPSRASLFRSSSTPRLNLVLPRGSLSSLPRRPSIPPNAIGSVPGLSGHAIARRQRLPPRVRRHRASRPQGSSSNWCCLFRCQHGPIFVRFSFPTPISNVIILQYSGHVRYRQSIGGAEGGGSWGVRFDSYIQG